MEGYKEPRNTTESHNTESLEVAEKAALEKLESLLGEKPIEQFSVRFMNIDEYRKMMSGESVGSGEANVLGRRRSRFNGQISEKDLERLRSRIQKGFTVGASIDVIHQASVDHELRKRGLYKKDEPETRSEEKHIGAPKLSAEEYRLLTQNNLEKFLLRGVSGRGWQWLAKDMTDWEMSTETIGDYNGYNERRSIFDKLLNTASKKAKEVGFEGKTGEEKKSYYLSILREEILKSNFFDEYEDVLDRVDRLKEDIQHFKEKLEKLKNKVPISKGEIDYAEGILEAKEKLLSSLRVEYLDTIKSFQENPRFLEEPGNLKKLFFALSGLGDVKAGLRQDGGVAAFQYHIAVLFKLIGDEGGGGFAREEWGYASRRKENILTAISLIPDPELEKEVVGSSKDSNDNAFPVFNNYGSLKFPQLLDSE